ncbi:TPA: helix-turn-helix domain-containing protein [Escherichia coli]
MGEIIKRKRKELNMTGKQLANLLGISQQHYSRLENGKVKVSVESLYAISFILGVSPYSLLPSYDLIRNDVISWAEIALTNKDILLKR